MYRKTPLCYTKTAKRTTTLKSFSNLLYSDYYGCFNQDFLFRVPVGPSFVTEICLILKPGKILLIFCGLPIKAISHSSAFLKLSNLFCP